MSDNLTKLIEKTDKMLKKAFQPSSQAIRATRSGPGSSPPGPPPPGMPGPGPAGAAPPGGPAAAGPGLQGAPAGGPPLPPGLMEAVMSGAVFPGEPVPGAVSQPQGETVKVPEGMALVPKELLDYLMKSDAQQEPEEEDEESEKSSVEKLKKDVENLKSQMTGSVPAAPPLQPQGRIPEVLAGPQAPSQSRDLLKAVQGMIPQGQSGT